MPTKKRSPMNFPKPKTRIESSGLDTIRIRPGEGVSLAKIRRALQVKGLDPVVSWHRKELYLPATVFSRMSEALEGIELEVAPTVGNNQRHIQKDEEFLRRAKKLIHDLTRPGAAQNALPGFSGLDVLDPHQVEAVAIATHPEMTGLCIFDEQGLGKTVTT